jgi:hypothetical protein
MAELTLVPKRSVDYRDDLISRLKAAASAESRDALHELSFGSLDDAEVSLHRAQELVKFAGVVNSFRSTTS